MNDILNGVIEIILRYKQKEKNAQKSLNADNSLTVPKVKNLCDYIKKSISNPRKKVIISLKLNQMRFNYFLNTY